MKIFFIITNKTLPILVLATKGTIVENLLQTIIDISERIIDFHLIVFTVHNKKAKKHALKFDELHYYQSLSSILKAVVQ